MYSFPYKDLKPNWARLWPDLPLILFLWQELSETKGDKDCLSSTTEQDNYLSGLFIADNIGLN